MPGMDKQQWGWHHCNLQFLKDSEEIKQNLHEKYCKGKLRQKQITEYFK